MNNAETTRNYFNTLADKWDTICHHNSEKINAILTLAGIKENSRILDIATGTGVLIPYLLKYQPALITAIDLSELMIAEACKKHPEPQVHFKVGNFYEWGETGFDLAIAYSCYPHFSDKKAFASQLSACLNENGRFVIAHSESRETINSRHSGDQVKKVSSHLQAVKTEAEIFDSDFKLDILVDTTEIYIISGTKRPLK
ncbi:class I SAM-dependent DNA methyltransferase [Acetobacterium woodii]|uniref:Methyltransferase domain-containing protein n=1 Tax=Acetobacterium woodii (strain ATCC 29683 / DSM 1030 / JCM 2381 / KCTC 1655 / WB1) TaxID=931626 RepID=H6LIP7_ACEWD|nr:class I SAM-dependent methyltransferase [Acetobacterium woodii]AFA48621.1 hypothetical protein Awo_c18420 [Acetobacterium woodii DSM 1030]